MIKREDIKYRVGSQTYEWENGKKTNIIKGATFLIYIDARVAFVELDKAGKWSFDWQYIQGETGVKGTLEIDGRKFSDVGYPNQSKIDGEGDGRGEWLKDAVSDSVKRCAVQYGIGRELYSAPLLYTTELNLSADRTRISPYEPLTDMGIKMIEGNIDKWYAKLMPDKK